MKDELVAFVHCSNPLAQQDEISLDILRQTPIVLRELGSGTLDVIQKKLQENGIALSDLNIEMNLGTTEGIKHFVEHSLSMGISSVRAIYRSIYEQVFKVLEIENLKMERDFMFVEKRGEAAKLLQTFKRFITKDYNV